MTRFPDIEDVEKLLKDLVATKSAAKAAGEAAKLTGLPRKELYQRLLDRRKRMGAEGQAAEGAKPSAAAMSPNIGGVLSAVEGISHSRHSLSNPLAKSISSLARKTLLLSSR